MDRQEVWEHLVGAVEREFTSGEFEEGEFRVVHNGAMRSITVVDKTGQALQLLDVTGSTFTGGHDENDPVLVRLSSKPWAQRTITA